MNNYFEIICDGTLLTLLSFTKIILSFSDEPHYILIHTFYNIVNSYANIICPFDNTFRLR